MTLYSRTTDAVQLATKWTARGYGPRHFERNSLRAKTHGLHKLFVSVVFPSQKRSKSSGVVAAHLLKNVAPAAKLTKFNTSEKYESQLG